MKKQLDLLALNPVQLAQEMLHEKTPGDLKFHMSLRDLTDVSNTLTIDKHFLFDSHKK